MFFLLYKRTDDGVLIIFRRFPTTLRRFPKNCSLGQTDVPNIFRKLTKISEDFRRLPKIAEDFREDP